MKNKTTTYKVISGLIAGLVVSLLFGGLGVMWIIGILHHAGIIPATLGWWNSVAVSALISMVAPSPSTKK